MNNLHSVSHTLNEIFSEINEASQININYSEIPGNQNNNGEQEYKINNVNGFTSANAFNDWLNSLGSGVRKAVIEHAKELEPAERSTLFFEAFSRAQQLSSRVFQVYLPSNDPEEKTQHCNIYYLFKKPSFAGDTCHLDSHFKAIAIARQAAPFARYWDSSLKLLQFQLICLITTTEYDHICDRMATATPEERAKLPIKATVVMVAVFARLLYESDIFDMNNKSKICRIVAELFCTPNQPEVSIKSFKNHFDCPPSDILDQLNQELSRWKSQIPHLALLN